MRHAATLERLGFAASVVGLLSLFAALAQPAATGTEPRSRESGMAAKAAERLAIATEARCDGRRDDQFDAIVGSLVAGLGDDTPIELAPALDTIRRARANEVAAMPTRTAARAAERARDSDVERGLAAAHRALGAVEATAQSDAVSGRRAVMPAICAGAIGVTLGLGALALAAMARRRERRAICALRGVDASAAHSGRLDTEFRRTATHGSAPRSTSSRAEPMVPSSADPPPLAALRRPAAPASGDMLFGQILEITAIEE